jgi:hypothetical protein
MPVCPVRLRIGLYLQGGEGPHQSLGEGYRRGLALTSDILLNYGELLVMVSPEPPHRFG